MRTMLLCVACSLALMSCGKTTSGGSSQPVDADAVRSAPDSASAGKMPERTAGIDAMQVKGLSLGMDIQNVPVDLMNILADQQLSGFGFTDVIRQGNGAQCVLMYSKAFMQALEQRAHDRYGKARAQGNVDQGVLDACENSDGVMTAHAGPDGRVTRIQINDVKHLFGLQGASPADFAQRLAAEMQLPGLTPNETQTAWNYTSPQGSYLSIETKTVLGIPVLRLVLSKSGS